MDKDIISFIEKEYDEEKIDDVRNGICETINNSLKRSGIMFRLFSRRKEKESVINKLEEKIDKYIERKRGLQDLIGIRIVLYFKEDVDICINLLSSIFNENNHERDIPDGNTFKPVRINYVYDLPSTCEKVDLDYKGIYLIDNTFEVQIRTVLSEGWHEVEHDIRYKNKADWIEEDEMSRDLNALLAVLEICDSNILGICDNLAYNKYKKQEIEAMIRCRFRMRFSSDKLSDELLSIINDNYEEIAKPLFRFDKETLVHMFYLTKVKTSIDNAIKLINLCDIKNDEIYNLTSDEIKNNYENIKSSLQLSNSKKNSYHSIVGMKYQ